MNSILAGNLRNFFLSSYSTASPAIRSSFLVPLACGCGMITSSRERSSQCELYYRLQSAYSRKPTASRKTTNFFAALVEVTSNHDRHLDTSALMVATQNRPDSLRGYRPSLAPGELCRQTRTTISVKRAHKIMDTACSSVMRGGRRGSIQLSVHARLRER